MKVGDELTTEKGTGKIICIVQPKGKMPAEYLVYYPQEDMAEWIEEVPHGA